MLLRGSPGPLRPRQLQEVSRAQEAQDGRLQAALLLPPGTVTEQHPAGEAQEGVVSLPLLLPTALCIFIMALLSYYYY